MAPLQTARRTTTFTTRRSPGCRACRRATSRDGVCPTLGPPSASSSSANPSASRTACTRECASLHVKGARADPVRVLFLFVVYYSSFSEPRGESEIGGQNVRK
eukprot:919818-Prorocentrum_minimum.AAC.5